MSNYPDSVRIGDPNAPWNRDDRKPHVFRVEVTFEVIALDEDHARDMVRDHVKRIAAYGAAVTECIDDGEPIHTVDDF